MFNIVEHLSLLFYFDSFWCPEYSVYSILQYILAVGCSSDVVGRSYIILYLNYLYTSERLYMFFIYILRLATLRTIITSILLIYIYSAVYILWNIMLFYFVFHPTSIKPKNAQQNMMYNVLYLCYIRCSRHPTNLWHTFKF